GVERETQACGTAAIAVALTAWIRDRLSPPIPIVPLSRSTLTVAWEGKPPDQLRAIFLEGGAEILGIDTVEVSLEDDEW
ncbi:MAG: diaminopimelate epimerase, partial [Candidatus Kapabacteria bacterium]|nr:diaminopimelate epimerase [Candidatus Kapabacteria bacterium]